MSEVAGGTGGQQVQSFALLGRMMAESARASDAFPLLHEEAMTAIGGRCSVLLQVNPRTSLLHPTSIHNLEALPLDPWEVNTLEARAADEAFGNEFPLVIPNLRKRLPGLAESLGTVGAVFVPLLQFHEPAGLLVIGIREAPAEIPDRLLWVGHAFVLALERARLQRQAELQQEVRRLLDAFSRVASSALNLVTGLEVFCRDANRLFNARRTSVWFHDRQARDVVLTASSDPSHLARGTRVSAEAQAAPATAMRRPRAEIRATEDHTSAVNSTITVPLKGRRRALGTLVFDAVSMDPGTELDVLDNADEVGRQLSSAIENVQLLEEVLRSRREMEKTVNTLPDLVAVCDQSLRLLNVNQTFSERVGLPRGDVVGRKLGDFVSLDAISWISKLDLAGGSAGSTQSFTKDVDDAVLGGRFTITVSSLLGQDGEPLGSVVVARDVTPQAKLEAEHAALHDRLTQSEKLAVLGQFVAGIAHELNNPLQTVLGHVELLRARDDLSKDILRELQLVYREADRSAKIVGNLLVFAGGRRLSHRVVNLNSLVGKALASRELACRTANIDMVRHFDEEVPKIAADPVMLQQAVLNVVINAEQSLASRVGGRIDVWTKYWPARSLVVIEIRDNGPGIAPESLAHVFEPFYTTKEVGQGTGLGLAVTYGIVQEHGGQVLAANSQEGGAVFTIELPVAQH
jgi:PAS domain S-box-containing protein